MKKTILKTILFSLLILFGCKKKDLPQEASGNPVFSLSCTVDGQPVLIEAGNMDYYMKSSYYYDTLNGIYVFKGDLSKKTNTGAYSLTLLINNYRPTPASSPMYTDTALTLGTYKYNDATLTGLTQNITFTPIKTFEFNDGYVWRFKEASSDEWSVLDVYSPTQTFELNKTYSVSCIYSDNFGGCTNIKHTNVFAVGNPLQTTVNAVRDSTSSVPVYKYSYTGTGLKPFKSCRWDFGDGSNATTISPTHTFQTSGFYTTTLTVVDAANNVCTSYYQINTDSYCQSNFTANFAPLSNTRLNSRVTVLLTDPDGNTYSTKDLSQPANSNFQLLSVEDYHVNDNNQATKLLMIKFNCTLKLGAKLVKIENGLATLAVSYK